MNSRNIALLQTQSIRSTLLIDDVIDGNFSLEHNNSLFVASKKLTKNQIAKGQTVLAIDGKGVNKYAHLYEVMGFTGDDGKYGECKDRFDSVKSLLKHFNVKNLQALETMQSSSDKEYGHHSYMVLRDLQTGETGAWFYLYNGNWCMGSSASSLKFVELKAA